MPNELKIDIIPKGFTKDFCSCFKCETTKRNVNIFIFKIFSKWNSFETYICENCLNELGFMKMNKDNDKSITIFQLAKIFKGMNDELLNFFNNEFKKLNLSFEQYQETAIKLNFLREIFKRIKEVIDK
jgi:hypothetical protein